MCDIAQSFPCQVCVTAGQTCRRRKAMVAETPEQQQLVKLGGGASLLSGSLLGINLSIWLRQAEASGGACTWACEGI